MSRGLQPMPVATAILKGATIVDPHSDIIDRADTIRAAVRDSVFVKAEAASQMYWLTDNYYDANSDFPPLRLPYPNLWLEWVVPDRWLDAASGWHDLESHAPRDHFTYAHDLGRHEEFNLPEGTHTTIQYIGGWMQDGVVAIPPGVLLAHINERGELLGGVSQGGDIWAGLGVIGNNNPDELSFLKVAALAVGLMNCRNVTLGGEQVITLRRSGTEKRRGIPAQQIRYHTIVLPSPGDSSNGNGQPHSTPALHTVRGHFATYTAEAPLFGRYVGTYWKPWHLSGNPEHGVVVSDYRLDPPA